METIGPINFTRPYHFDQILSRNQLEGHSIEFSVIVKDVSRDRHKFLELHTLKQTHTHTYITDILLV